MAQDNIKIPRTFRPEGNLEEKTQQLVRNATIIPEPEEQTHEKVCKQTSSHQRNVAFADKCLMYMMYGSLALLLGLGAYTLTIIYKQYAESNKLKNPTVIEEQYQPQQQNQTFINDFLVTNKYGRRKT